MTPTVIQRNCARLELHRCDCMDLMRGLPDKAYDLAIVDPPYGAKFNGPCGRLKRYGTIESANSNPPNQEYFNELFRVSVNQVVWGGNYFSMPPCQAFLIWDKRQPVGLTFADSEFAWTSLDGVARTFRFRPQGADEYTRIHPTQKPVALYSWLLANYAKPGQSILDTHLGSGSIAIACLNHGYNLTACELDDDYFKAATERIQREANQQVML